MWNFINTEFLLHSMSASTFSKRYAKILHEVFEAGIFLKFFDGLIELFVGFLLFFMTPTSLNAVLSFLLRGELFEDPRDFIANGLLHLFQDFSLTQQHFVMFYLLLNGFIKVGLVIGLWSKKLWAYPAASVLLSLFVGYQTYYLIIAFSWFRLIFMFIDVFILVLLRFEYARLKNVKNVKNSKKVK